MKKMTVAAILIIALLLPGCRKDLDSESDSNNRGEPRVVTVTGDADVQVNANASNPRIITVTGDAEVRVNPDEVITTFGVETLNANLDTAKNQNDAIMDDFLDLAHDFGIESKHIQTDYINIHPMYDYASGSKRFEGYRVQKIIVVTLRELSQFEDFLSKALEIGVTHVHDIQFRTTELRQYKDQARALAIQAAKEKADALAGELDQHIGDPVTIQEARINAQSWYGFGWWGRQSNVVAQNVVVETDSGSLEANSAIAPGQITVKAQITVSFELK